MLSLHLYPESIPYPESTYNFMYTRNIGVAKGMLEVQKPLKLHWFVLVLGFVISLEQCLYVTDIKLHDRASWKHALKESLFQCGQ